MKKVSIVIPVVNLWFQYTKPCINSLEIAMTPLDEWRILLIDNGSTDETFMKAQEEKNRLENLEIVRFDDKRSLSFAWNYGIKDSLRRGYEYVFVINNDVLFHNRAVIELVERMNKKDVLLASCLDVREECIVPEDINDMPDKKDVPESEHPNFSAFMVDRRLIDVVGEFDQGFDPAYFEDNDMHYRIKLANEKAICYPPAMFYHFGSRTQNQDGFPAGMVDGEKFERCRSYYRQKWGGDPGFEKFTNPFNDPSRNFRWVKQYDVV